MQDKTLKVVLQKHRRNLRKSFFAFARKTKGAGEGSAAGVDGGSGGGGGGPASNSLNTMNQDEWMLFIKDMDLATVKMSKRDAREIFVSSQLDGNGKTGNDNQGADEPAGGASEMIFSEFLEACVALSLYQDPSPYVPLFTKVDKFFGEIFG